MLLALRDSPMPYEIKERDGQYCVVKKDDGKSLGCHDSEEGAKRQMRAVYANENLSVRLDSIERAVIALSVLELGDTPGHAFRGNQWRAGDSAEDFRNEKSGIPKGENVVLRDNGAGGMDVVKDGSQHLGEVEQVHYSEILGKDSYEARPVVGDTKTFDNVNDAVKHVLKETEDLHKMPIAASVTVVFGDQEGHEFHGNQWTGGKGGGGEDKPKGKDRDEKSVGSLTKKGGMVVSGGKTVHIGDKVTYSLTSALTGEKVGTGEGKVKEISRQGVGVKMSDGKINVFDPNDIRDGGSRFIKKGFDEGEVKFLVDNHKNLEDDQAVLQAFFEGRLVKASIEFGDSPGHPFRGNQYAEAAGEDLKKEGIDAKVVGDQVRVSDKDLLPVEHLEKTVEIAKKLEDKGYVTILGRHGESSHVTVTGKKGVTAAGNADSLIEWFNDGADGQINWGEEGDFDDCVALASKHMDEDQAKGFCNLRHQDATGATPGEAPGEGHTASAVERMESLEAAVIALSTMSLGDVSGHDFHGNQWTGGQGGGDSVTNFIADHPPLPNEPVFEWQSRIVKGLDPETKSEIIFATRERYEPCNYVKEGAAKWCADHGLEPPPSDILDQRVPLDEADTVGRIFEDAPDQSDDPEVQVAYDDFKRQNEEMFDYLTRPESEGGLGVKVDFAAVANPYDSAAAQAKDLIENHHITVATGLGGEHSATMTTDEYDRFRAVHDTFGHAGVGGGFDRHGEYEAWLMHASMYTDPGRLAMSTEYHAVNSALWSGDPSDPGGTGKSILLPDQYALPPWDREAVTAAANKREVQTIIKALKLDSEWATKFDTQPMHRHGGEVVASSQPVDRLDAIEMAVMALARLELGEGAGHPFRGNQWTPGESGADPADPSGLMGHTITDEDHLTNPATAFIRTKAVESLIDRVGKEGGVTINPVTGNEPTTGFIVATKENEVIVKEDRFFDKWKGVTEIEKYLTDHAEQLGGDNMFGIWHDKANAEVDMDIVESVADRDEAVKLGAERDQQSIWDVEKQEVIQTNG